MTTICPGASRPISTRIGWQRRPTSARLRPTRPPRRPCPPDPGTCPADLTASIARLTERRVARGESIGKLVTFAYRLPRPKGNAAIRRACEVADHILTCYGDHLDAHTAAAQWRTCGLSPLEAVFGATDPTDRDLVISVIERINAGQADAF